MRCHYDAPVFLLCGYPHLAILSNCPMYVILCRIREPRGSSPPRRADQFVGIFFISPGVGNPGSHGVSGFVVVAFCIARDSPTSTGRSDDVVGAIT